MSHIISRLLDTRTGRSRVGGTQYSEVLESALESDMVLGAKTGFRIRNVISLRGTMT